MYNFKISVIVAAYNIEEFIGRCIESLIKNKYKNLEIIIVNDGSQDATLEKIYEFKSRDNRIKVINQVNMGLIEARKSGYKNSTGDYIWFIDGDDWVEENSIDIIMKNIIEKDLDLLMFNCFYSYEDRSEKVIINNTNVSNNKLIIKELFIGNLSGAIWSKVIKKSFIEKNKIKFPSNITYGEDNAFSVSLLVNNPKVCVISDFLYHYYQRENSITKKISPKILELEKVNRFCEQQLKDSSLLDEVKDEFDYFLYRHNFMDRIKEIFVIKNEYSKELYNIWINLNLDIKNNTYFKLQEFSVNKLFIRLTYRNYFIGVILGSLYRKIK